MKTQWLSRRGQFVLGIGLASVCALLAGLNGAGAQDGQGIFITQAAARLQKGIDAANKDGYKLKDNSFSIGGGWIKQSKKDWVSLYKLNLQPGKDYRFLASGDSDARDVDLEVLNPNGDVVASDTAKDPNAIVDYRPKVGGQYTVRVRLFESRSNLPCVCLGIVLVK
jgi:hypothetical protein